MINVWYEAIIILITVFTIFQVRNGYAWGIFVRKTLLIPLEQMYNPPLFPGFFQVPPDGRSSVLVCSGISPSPQESADHCKVANVEHAYFKCHCWFCFNPIQINFPYAVAMFLKHVCLCVLLLHDVSLISFLKKKKDKFQTCTWGHRCPCYSHTPLSHIASMPLMFLTNRPDGKELEHPPVGILPLFQSIFELL